MFLTESLDRPVQFFTGKGGVGKSTVIAAVATRAARAGRRPLIVELGAHTSSSHLFDGDSVGYEPVEVLDGVHATRVLFEPALIDYIVSRLKLKPIAKMVARNSSLRRFFLAAPGVDEIVTLHRVAQLGADESWGPILVDLESTGHALMFFDLPKVLDGFLDDGPLRPIVDGATRMLYDPDQCAVHIVTVPEALPVRETIQLYKDLKSREQLPLGQLFVNRIPPAWFDSDARERITAAMRSAGPEDASRPLLELAEYLADRRDVAERCIRGLKHDVDLPTLMLETVHPSGPSIVAMLCEQMESLGQMEAA